MRLPWATDGRLLWDSFPDFIRVNCSFVVNKFWTESFRLEHVVVRRGKAHQNRVLLIGLQKSRLGKIPAGFIIFTSMAGQQTHKLGITPGDYAIRAAQSK